MDIFIVFRLLLLVPRFARLFFFTSTLFNNVILLSKERERERERKQSIFGSKSGHLAALGSTEFTINQNNILGVSSRERESYFWERERRERAKKIQKNK